MIISNFLLKTSAYYYREEVIVAYTRSGMRDKIAKSCIPFQMKENKLLAHRMPPERYTTMYLKIPYT